MKQSYPESIAPARPFAGPARITVPSVVGGPAGKPFLWRIGVLGERPVRITVTGLPEGLRAEGNVVSGTARESGRSLVTVRAENALGTDEKPVTLELGEGKALLTPLMGFTTWNAAASAVSDAFVRKSAALLVSTGLAEYGYAYVNVDSGWQGTYLPGTDVIAPNGKFPDMAALTAYIHSLGFKCGIYSTPMLTAWGCPKEMESIPGCTRGEPDDRFAMTNGGIGKERLERPNAAQWSRWGFDYLKYDFAPTEPVNAAPMLKALREQDRDFAFCTTVSCSPVYAAWWKKYVNSWRDNGDTVDSWPNTRDRLAGCEAWAEHVVPGHFYDLDMLAVGPMAWNDGKSRFTPAEALFTVTLHTFFPSPVQLSCRLDALSDFELALLGNEEVLAINQDAKCEYPRPVGENASPLKHYERTLEDGSKAAAFFNVGDAAEVLTLPAAGARIRDVWRKEDLTPSETLTLEVEAHGARLLRIFEK